VDARPLVRPRASSLADVVLGAWSGRISFRPLARSKPWISFTSSLRMKSIVSFVMTWPGTMIGKPGG
jgi:hypothetical protein